MDCKMCHTDKNYLTWPSLRPHGMWLFTVLWRKCIFFTDAILEWTFEECLQLKSYSLRSSVHPGKTKMSKVEYFLISSHLERVPASLFPADLYKQALLSANRCWYPRVLFSSVNGDMQKLHANSDCPCNRLTFLSHHSFTCQNAVSREQIICFKLNMYFFHVILSVELWKPVSAIE